MDTSATDLIADFFVPALVSSVSYDRGVGYFSSGWVRLAAEGMAEFAANGGRARWVTSPKLSEADWDALKAGEAAKTDSVLRAALERSITDLAETLERNTLSALAWMIADEVIRFKLALPRNKLDNGDFHDKFGIFTDAEGNQVCFNGSYNDSFQGTRNYESIKIFSSWHPAFATIVKSDAARFERLWNNLDPNVRVYDLPEAAREKILELRSSDRPYAEPEWLRASGVDTSSTAYRPAKPLVPGNITLHDYQLEAIDSWFEHDCRGLLEMATGTGKTITALAASARLYEREQRLAVVVTVPYQHLVDQWQEEAAIFGYRPVLAYRNTARWRDLLKEQIIEYNAGYRNFISVITTHTTFGKPRFQESIAKLKGPVLLIGDEAHHLGAERVRQNYPNNIQFRLALSATPERWFDNIGTDALRDYFGQTVFAFPLEKAIGKSLTPYYYYPHLVALTDEELEKYEQLSTKIAQFMSDKDNKNTQLAVKRLLIRRARLLNNAANKIGALSALVDRQLDIQHTLFYCAPGQINDVVSLLGWDKGLRVNRFTAEEDTLKRQQLLSDFANGNVQALVAMKCLDEGVDVPATRVAYILASSSNPREFIQRRGRVLRKSPNKEFSVIHDLIAVPPTAWDPQADDSKFQSERSIIRRELERFKEFASPALNKHEALDVVWNVAKRYGLMDF
jgi:DNA phosphorothioation system restriction enzyme